MANEELRATVSDKPANNDKGEKKVWNPLEAGEYTAKVISFTAVDKLPFVDKYTGIETGLEIKFKMLDIGNQKDVYDTVRMLVVWDKKTIHPKSPLGKVLAAIYGNPIKGDVIFNSYIDKKCKVHLVRKESKGKIYANIKTVEHFRESAPAATTASTSTSTAATPANNNNTASTAASKTAEQAAVDKVSEDFSF